MGVALELGTPLMTGTLWYLRGVVGVALADWSTVGVSLVNWLSEVGVLTVDWITEMGVSLVTSRSEVGVSFTGIGGSLVGVSVNFRSTETGVSLVPGLSNEEVE